MALKFSFKKEPRETGLAAVGNPYPNTQIKLDKQQVGYISAPTWQTKDRMWGVHFAVEKDGGCGWHWIHVKRRFDSEPESREWIKQNAEKVQKQFTLHKFED